MSQTHKIKRLLKLADFIETVPREALDLEVLARKHECGTVCCLMGWAGLMPKFRRLGFKTEFGPGGYVGFSNYSMPFLDAADFFGLDQYESYGLFSGLPQRNYYGISDPTPKQAARALRRFVTRKLKEIKNENID